MFNLDTDMIPFAITLTMMAVIFIFGIIASMIIIKTKQNKKSRDYMQALVDEKERTMYSISLEVHDNVTQMLIMSRMTLRLVQDGTHPDKESAMTEINNMLSTLIMDTQNISHSLNPDYLKRKGLLASLEEEAKWVNASKKLDCSLLIDGDAVRLDSQTELMVFRVAQEAIQNTVKYAEAQKITIMLSYDANAFRLAVVDDGIGFDIESEDVSEGVGMLSMKQRAKIVNGEITISSAPGRGTSVVLNIPDTAKNIYAA